MFENSVHFNHFGEYPAIEKSAAEYDSLIIPAHFFVSKRDQVSGLLHRLMTNHGVDYYISPQLPEYRIGDNFREESGELSEWNRNLADYFGIPLARILERRRNLRFHELNNSERRELVQQACDLQLTIAEKSSGDGSTQDSLSKYEDINIALQPRALIPWYVKIETASDVRANLEIISIADSYTEYPIKPCIFTDKIYIQSVENRKSLANAIGESSVAEAFLIIEDLNNNDTTIGDYVHTIDFVTRIADAGVEPHFLNGDYFGHLLGYFGLRGVGFGVFYSESFTEKSGEEGGGGGGLSRYYFNPAKEFLNIQETVKIATSSDAPLCDCLVCNYELSSWDDLYRIGDNYTLLQRHYIAQRNEQKTAILTEDLGDLIEELREADELFREPLGNSSTAANAYHLRKWAVAITHHIEESSSQNFSDYSGGLQKITDQ